MRNLLSTLVLIILVNNLLSQVKITPCTDVLDWSETEYTCVSIGVENTKLVKVTSYVKKVKEAEKQLKKDAIYCSLFKPMGPNEINYCNQQPPPVSEEIKIAKKDWFNNFFKDGGKYTDFVKLSESGYEEEDLGKVNKVKSVCNILYTDLRRYLESEHILEKINPEELPKIIIFPDPQWMSKKGFNGNYPKAMEDDIMNSAISSLQSILSQKGIDVVDLKETLDNKSFKDAVSKLQGDQEGVEAAALKVAQPEVKIYIGWKDQPDESGKGRKIINFNVKAIDVNTSKPWGNMGNILIESSANINTIIKTAILGKIDYPFMFEVQKNHMAVMKEGRSIKINISKAPSSQRAFMSDRSVDGKIFASFIKEYIKSISKDSKNCKSATEVNESLVYDVIIDPKYNGEINNASTFTERIIEYLYSKNVDSEKTVMGPAEVKIIIKN